MSTPEQFLGELIKQPNLRAQKQFLQQRASRLQDADFADLVAAQLKAVSDEQREAHGSVEKHIAMQYALAAQTGNPFHRALALRSDASAAMILEGRYDKTLNLLDQLSILYADSAPIEAARLQILRVVCLAKLNRFAETKQAFEQTAHFLHTQEAWELLARLYLNFASSYHRERGERYEEIHLLDQARTYLANLTAPIHSLEILIEQSRHLAQWGQGNFAKNLRAAEDAYQRAVQNQHPLLAAQIHLSIGIAHQIHGNYTTALHIFNHIRDVFDQGGDRYHLFWADLHISSCLIQLQRFFEARMVCERARQIDSQAPIDMGRLLLNEVRIYTQEDSRNYEKALPILVSARSYFSDADAVFWVAIVELEIAHIYYILGQYETSLEMLQTNLPRLALAGQRIWVVQAELAIVRAAIAAQKWAVAKQALDRAEQATDVDEVWLRYQLFYWQGMWAKYQNRSEALSYFEQSIDALEVVTGQIITEFRPIFLLDKQTVYEEAVALYLENDDLKGGLEYAERAKSRALLDMLAYRVELRLEAQDTIDIQLVEQLKALQQKRNQWVRQQKLTRLQTPTQEREQTHRQVNQLENQIAYLWHQLLDRNAVYGHESALWKVHTAPIQTHLQDREVLLEFFVIHDQLIVFTLSKNAIQLFRLDAQLSQVTKLIHSLERTIRATPRIPDRALPAWTSQTQGFLKKLYSLLFEPLNSFLDSYDHLFIVPHASLHRIPFHALWNGQQYLIEQYTLSQLPSGSMLPFCRKPTESPLKFAAFSCIGQTPIPYALAEAKQVAALMKGDVFLNEDATVEQFRLSANQYSVLHLAMHGHFNTQMPLFSGLEFYDQELTMLELFNVHLRTDLVVLGACSTGTHELGGGDELIGFMRAFLHAGASSLVLSLWAVNDHSTQLWMANFYQALSVGRTKAEAIQIAHRHLLTSSQINTRYKHPYYWAPFQLIGSIEALSTQ